MKSYPLIIVVTVLALGMYLWPNYDFLNENTGFSPTDSSFKGITSLNDVSDLISRAELSLYHPGDKHSSKPYVIDKASLPSLYLLFKQPSPIMNKELRSEYMDSNQDIETGIWQSGFKRLHSKFGLGVKGSAANVYLVNASSHIDSFRRDFAVSQVGVKSKAYNRPYYLTVNGSNSVSKLLNDLIDDQDRTLNESGFNPKGVMFLAYLPSEKRFYSIDDGKLLDEIFLAFLHLAGKSKEKLSKKYTVLKPQRIKDFNTEVFGQSDVSENLKAVATFLEKKSEEINPESVAEKLLNGGGISND